MSVSREFLLDRGFCNIAPIVVDKIVHALEISEIPGNYGAISEVNKEWRGHIMHVVGIDLPEGLQPALFEHPFQRRTFLERAVDWTQQARIRHLQAVVHGSKHKYGDIKVEPYKWATNQEGVTLPLRRVDEFTATLKHLPTKMDRTAVFAKDVNERFGRVTSFTTITAELFDPETREPKVEIYDLGVDSRF